MTEKIGEAVLEIRTDSAKLNRGVDAGQRKAEKLERTFKSAKLALGAFAGVLSVGALIKGVKAVTTAFGVQEEAVANLRASLAQTGKEGSAALQLLTRNASALQRVTTKGDEAIIAATASLSLLATELTATELAEAQKAMIGIADVFLKGDVQNAAIAIGKSLGSTTNALVRYGIEIDSTASQSEKLRQILGVTNKLFEVSKARAETLQGVSQQLANSWGDFQEALGEAVVKGLKMVTVLAALKEAVEKFTLAFSADPIDEQQRHLNKLLKDRQLLIDNMARGVSDRRFEEMQRQLDELDARIRQTRASLRQLGGPPPGTVTPLAAPGGLDPEVKRQFLAEGLPVEDTREEPQLRGEMREIKPPEQLAELTSLREALGLTIAQFQEFNRLMAEGADATEAFKKATESEATQLTALAGLIGTQLTGALVGAIFGLNSLTDSMRALAITILNQLVGTGIKAALTSMGLPSFQAGGMVPGGGATPIIAHAGEAVINARGVQSLGGAGAIAAVNSGQGLRLSIDAASFPEPADYGIIASKAQVVELFRRVASNAELAGWRPGNG